MKYQSLQAFEKHLEEAGPEQLSSIYMVIVPSDFERRRAIDAVVHAMKKRDSAMLLSRFEAATALGAALDTLGTRPLFGGSSLVLLEGVQLLKKNGLELLEGYLMRPAPHANLILGGSSFKPLSDIYQKAKKEIVVLDLSEEKPWDRQKRLREWAVSFVSKEGKQIATDAVAFLFEQVGFEMSILEQELLKLIAYIGERPRIDLTDVRALCVKADQQTEWQKIEALVWEGRLGVQVEDLTSFLQCLGLVRYHLQIGQQLAAYLCSGLAPQEISAQFPQFKPASFDKYLAVARKKGPDYFKKRLHTLLDLEVLSKNSALDAKLLWTLLVTQVRL